MSKSNLPLTLTGEAIEYQRLYNLTQTAGRNMTTTGTYSFPSISSGTTYSTVSGGEYNVFLQLQTALANYLINDTDYNGLATQASVTAVADDLASHRQEKATEAELGHVIIGTGLDVNAGGVARVEADIARLKKGSGTYTDNDTSQTFSDAFCTADSLVTIVITSVTLPQGVWSAESGAGSFTITSTKAESADITFDYYIQKVVG